MPRRSPRRKRSNADADGAGSKAKSTGRKKAKSNADGAGSKANSTGRKKATTTTTTTTTTGSSNSSSSNTGGDGAGGEVEFDITTKDEKWLRGGNLNEKIQWKRFFEYVDKVENEHIIIQLNNGSLSMDTKWIKALYNLGIASFGDCPSNGLQFTKSSLNLDTRISCRCVDSKHCSKICGICGPVCGKCVSTKRGRRKVLQQTGEKSKVVWMSESAKREFIRNAHSE